jgi:acetylornithine deacetylase
MVQTTDLQQFAGNRVKDIDGAVRDAADGAIELLRDLVRSRSTLGQEAEAQEILALAVEDAGFAVERLPLTDAIGDDPLAGVPQVPYEGRYDLVGRRPGGGGARSLLLNGHIDIVPVEDGAGWSAPPFGGLVRDGWLIGRGAGDMKGGFAAGLLALTALDAVRPGWQAGDLTLLSVIEEEATGNGTLAAARAGVLADGVLLLEPTDLEVLLAGIAVVWVDLEWPGRSGHSEAGERSVNPIRLVPRVIDGLDALESAMNEEHRTDPDPAFASIEHPYHVNIGRFDSGAWGSSVPETACMRVRIGHPGNWTAEDARTRVEAAVREATSSDPWLAEHRPRARLTGVRAERYVQDPDVPLVRGLAAAHAAVHGREPGRGPIRSTTDARYYVNHFGVPAAAYGPRSRNMHGVDEAVELASIVECARTLARFLLSWSGDS